jgi:hypothetical protein
VKSDFRFSNKESSTHHIVKLRLLGLLPGLGLTTLVSLCALGIAFLVGCASVAVRKVSAGDTDSLEGVRFYRPAPYLVVSASSSDSKQTSAQAAKGSSTETLQYAVVWMPDLSQEYVIQVKSGLGSVTFNPTLENGWNLTGLNATTDSKTAELLTALTGLVPKTLTSAAGLKPAKVVPGMYRLVFQTDRNQPNYGQLIGVDFQHPIFTTAQ